MRSALLLAAALAFSTAANAYDPPSTTSSNAQPTATGTVSASGSVPAAGSTSAGSVTLSPDPSLAAAEPAKPVCQGLSGTKVFMAFNPAPEEVEQAREAAADACENFTVVSSQKQADQTFAKLNKSGEKITSLILSGHAVEGKFYGDNPMSMSQDQFIAFLNKYPTARDNIETPYFWGCYSTDVEKLEKWLSASKNFNRVYGFRQLAPLSSQMVGAEYLRRALTQDDALKKATSLDEVKKILDKDAGDGNGFYTVTAAVWGKCEKCGGEEYYYYVSPDDASDPQSPLDSHLVDYSEYKKQCGSTMADYLKDTYPLMRKYWEGKLPIPDPDSKVSTDPKQFPLRRGIYPQLNINEHCFTQGFLVDPKVWINIGQTVNLIFLPNIEGNFFQYFASDVSAAVAALKHTGLSTVRNALKKGDKMTRADIYQADKALMKMIKKGTYGSAKKSEIETLKKFTRTFDQILYEMRDQCVPLEWQDKDKASIPVDIPSTCTTP
jgi:hypothetical protein